MLKRFEQFSYVISGINRCIQKIETEEMEKYGCKGAYAQYLIALKNHPDGLSIAKLSEICDKDKAAVSRYISEMQEKKLVERENKDSGKYNTRIRLTSEGIKAHSFIYTRAMEIVRNAGRDISDENRQILYDSLDKIYSSLSEIANKN